MASEKEQLKDAANLAAVGAKEVQQQQEEAEERAGLLDASDSDEGDGGSIYQPGKDAGNICLKPGYRPGTVWEEAKKLLPLAWQVVLATVLQSMTQQVTVLFVGHIGVMELGASALATMWVNITGLSIVYGGASALDSLAAQAYGAKSYQVRWRASNTASSFVQQHCALAVCLAGG